MSAIAGVCTRDRQPVDSTILPRMLDQLAGRGPHSQGQWSDGPVGLAHRLLQTTPESLKERQPVSDARGECWLVWDGRLDNRDELIRLLKNDGFTLGAETDPELMLSAFRRWDLDCFQRILGDFALALWDSRTKRLVCARDPIGVKPFYYHLNKQRLIFSSAMKAILEDSNVARRPNDAMIADYLLMGFRDAEATFFDGVKQLPPGHVLCFQNGKVTVTRYWDIEPAKEIRYPNEADYLEAFRELFRKAVQCRLRSHGDIGILLSGGIDSTAMTAMAESIRHEALAPSVLEAYTFLHHGFIREEWEALQALIQRYGTMTHFIPQKSHGAPITGFEVYLTASETLHYEGFLTLPLLMEPAARNGVRVFLTGFGADELFRMSELGFLEDLLRAGQINRLRSEIRLMAKAYGTDPGGTLTALLWTQLPTRVRRLVKTLCGRRLPAWADPAFAKRVNLAAWTALQPSRKFPTRCQAVPYRAVTGPSMAMAMNWMDATASAYSMECRHPYLDRRVVEFVLSLPTDVKMNAGYRKMFVQRALRGISAGPLRPCEGTDLSVPDMDPQMEKERDALRLRRDLFTPGSPVFRYVKPAELARIRDWYLAGEERYRNLLWQFGNLERWLFDYCPSGPSASGEGP